MTKFHRSRIGFVFQQFNLLPTLTEWQNVTLRLAGRKIDRRFVRSVLERAGSTTVRRSCPAASSSGWRSCVRSSPGRT